MRIRSVFALSAGAAMGAGTMYLLDPDQGGVRRRELAVRAADRGRQRLGAGSDEARRRVSERVRFYVGQARSGFDETGQRS